MRKFSDVALSWEEVTPRRASDSFEEVELVRWDENRRRCV